MICLFVVMIILKVNLRKCLKVLSSGTNVFLNLYLYSKESSSKALSTLDSILYRIVVSYCVTFEFAKNR